MTALSERDRAKRAKLKARYNAIKQKSAGGDVGTYSPVPNSPKPDPSEVRDNRDDEQFKSATISASDSASRDTAPSSESDDVDDRATDVPMKSQSDSHRTKANQLAIAKKKLAASRKASSPMKTAYSYTPMEETQKVARPTPPVEETVKEPYTPPRVVSKRAEMARKLAASRAATSSPQPPMHKPEQSDVRSSPYVNRAANTYAGSVKQKTSSFEKPQEYSGRAQMMNKVTTNKTTTTRSNELARLRAASPAVVAAATVKHSQTRMGYSTSNQAMAAQYDSDEDTASLWDEHLAKDAVLHRREQFRKKQEENQAPTAISNPSIRQQYFEKQEEKKRMNAFSDPSFLQHRTHKHDQFDSSFQNHLVSMSDDVSDPPLASLSQSSSLDRNATKPATEIHPTPQTTYSEKGAQDFGEGFGFSQEEFSHASWGLGPAFSSEVIANNSDADWSRPVNCTSDQRGGSAEWAANFSGNVSNEEEEENAVIDEDKENTKVVAEVSPAATSSVQYVDFGVGKSRGESVDCDSVIDEKDELDNNSIISEETTASATEFDPLSMFGGSDDVSQEIEAPDENAQSRSEEQVADNSSNDPIRSTSSSSEKLTRQEDETNSISFPSLNSGNLPPKPAHQIPANNSTKIPPPPPPPPPAKNVIRPPPDSPSGTESLESWWQSRYASSQNNDINAAVQGALLNEASSVSKKSQADSSKNTSAVSTLSNSLTPVRSNERAPSREIDDDESCSIFSGISGIDEDAQRDSRYKASKTQNRLDSVASVETEADEDIFSGVSVSNTKDMQADDVAMKSVFGGNSSGFTLKRTNAESQSMLYGSNTVGVSPYAQSKVMNSLADNMSTASFSSPKMQTPIGLKDSLSSLQENNYGVIELKNNEKSSPANSHTSDITSSVIFGFDPPRRSVHQRYGRDHERIIEANESEEDSVISNQKSEHDDVNKSLIANRAVSLVAPSTCDSTSQASMSDHTKTTGVQSDSESQSTPFFGLAGLRDQAKAAILSRFSCGLLNTSSFAVCAPKEHGLVSKSEGQMQTESSLTGSSSDSNNKSDSSKDDDIQSQSPDNESYDGNSRRSLDASSKKEVPPPMPFSPHSIRLRESSFVKGGVEVMSEAVPKVNSSAESQNELPVYQSASDAQKEAYEALLLYAYTALSVPPPKNIVEKGLRAETNPTVYPSIDGGVKVMGIMMERFRREGIAVLKLNTHNQWQPRVLTVTKEVHVFNETDDVRDNKGIDSCPKGLLWLKKFSDSEQSVASITEKKGKGGIFFSTIDSVAITKGIHPLSKKQQKGEFKDSYTFVVFSNDNGSKREIYFRVANKDDVVLLSAGLQAVIDRSKKDEKVKSRSFKLTVDTLAPGVNTVGAPSQLSPILSPTKPLSVTKKAVANPISDHRWEV